MEKKKDIQLQPYSFFCISCAMEFGEEVPADHLIWNEEEQKAIPLCNQCHEMSMRDKMLYRVFSVN